jgi:hypothetical protein
MDTNLLDEIRKLRSQLVHGARPFDHAELRNRFSEMGLSIPEADLPEFTIQFLSLMGGRGGQYYVPQLLTPVLSELLHDRSGGTVCDPWAGVGSVLSLAREATQATKAIAITQNETEAALGRVLLRSAEWLVGDPYKVLRSLSVEFDVVASMLPFGMRSSTPIEAVIAATSMLPFDMRGSTPIEVGIAADNNLPLRRDLGEFILVTSSLKLSASGIALFIIPQTFFSQHSTLRQFNKLQLGITAAFALPTGAFAPYTNVSTYLVAIVRNPCSRLFVAQLSSDLNTNLQMMENFRQGREGATLELGRFVETSLFIGLDALRVEERLQLAERRFGYPAIPLKGLSSTITIGRSEDSFAFPKKENSILVPLIGNGSVIDSLDEGTLKPHNYAQVAIDPATSDARFVARFLNSEFGREIRELSKSGLVPRLNRSSLEGIRVFIPDLQTQRLMLATEARIVAEENTLLSLRNELAECRRELWGNPTSQPDVNRRLDVLSSKLSGDLKRQVIERLDQWFESLPFPMASILRAWQATPSDDFKTKHEHLLHFFEAFAEFTGIILLSAFSSREEVFEEIKNDLHGALKKQNLSFKRATFGTWKLVIDYLGKRVRQLLSGDRDQLATCADMFADPSMEFAKAVSRKELAEIVSLTNKLRNDWAGHGGVVGQEEAHLRNEQLLAEVQKLREVTIGLWSGDTQLIHALHCRPRKGLFENEVALLMGSNSEFLKETVVMPTWLDLERLYILQNESRRGLQLLPLVQVGPSPSSAKNACYFFSRVEKDGLRYVSYHFIDQPERKYLIEDASEAMSLLQED